jgi:hypothetical protein
MKEAMNELRNLGYLCVGMALAITMFWMGIP